MTSVEIAKRLVGVLELLDGLDANDAMKVLTCAQFLLNRNPPSFPADIRTVPGIFDGSIADGITDEQLEKLEDEGGHVSQSPSPSSFSLGEPFDPFGLGPISIGGLAPHRDPG